MNYFVKIIPTKKYTSRGQKYEAWLKVLLCTSLDPEYDSCRKLKELGYSGTVHFYRETEDKCDSKISIEKGAKYRTLDVSSTNLRITRYKPLLEGTF